MSSEENEHFALRNGKKSQAKDKQEKGKILNRIELLNERASEKGQKPWRIIGSREVNEKCTLSRC